MKNCHLQTTCLQDAVYHKGRHYSTGRSRQMQPLVHNLRGDRWCSVLPTQPDLSPHFNCHAEVSLLRSGRLMTRMQTARVRRLRQQHCLVLPVALIARMTRSGAVALTQVCDVLRCPRYAFGETGSQQRAVVIAGCMSCVGRGVMQSSGALDNKRPL